MTVQPKITAALIIAAALLAAACGSSSSGGPSSSSNFPDEVAGIPRAQSVGPDEYSMFQAQAADTANEPDTLEGDIQADFKLVANFADDDEEAIIAFSDDDDYALLLFKPEAGGVETPYFLTGDANSDLIAVAESLGEEEEDPAWSGRGGLFFPEAQEYSVMGVWAEDASDFLRGSGGGNSGYDFDNFRPFYFGLETPDANIPATGSGDLTYTGSAFGIYAVDGGDRYFLFSEGLAFVVNFASKKIAGTIDLHAFLPPTLLAFEGEFPMPAILAELTSQERADLTAAGQFPFAVSVDLAQTDIGSDGTFEGSASVQRDTKNDDNPAFFGGLNGVTGEFKGDFYGPAAQELAGVAEVGGGSGQDKLSLGFIADEE